MSTVVPPSVVVPLQELGQHHVLQEGSLMNCPQLDVNLIMNCLLLVNLTMNCLQLDVNLTKNCFLPVNLTHNCLPPVENLTKNCPLSVNFANLLARPQPLVYVPPGSSQVLHKCSLAGGRGSPCWCSGMCPQRHQRLGELLEPPLSYPEGLLGPVVHAFLDLWLDLH